jgi:plasmid maintenance system antidote protein VapI
MMKRGRALFGPTSKNEELVFAVEELLADVQLAIQESMLELGVSRSDLAKRLGCSPANVTQLLSEEANLTVQTVARIFHALNMACEFHPKARTEVQGNRMARQLQSDRNWEITLPDERVVRMPMDETAAGHDRHKESTAAAIMGIASEAMRQHRFRPRNNNMVPDSPQHLQAA